MAIIHSGKSFMDLDCRILCLICSITTGRDVEMEHRSVYRLFIITVVSLLTVGDIGAILSVVTWYPYQPVDRREAYENDSTCGPLPQQELLGIWRHSG